MLPETRGRDVAICCQPDTDRARVHDSRRVSRRVSPENSHAAVLTAEGFPREVLRMLDDGRLHPVSDEPA